MVLYGGHGRQPVEIILFVMTTTTTTQGIRRVAVSCPIGLSAVIWLRTPPGAQCHYIGRFAVQQMQPGGDLLAATSPKFFFVKLPYVGPRVQQSLIFLQFCRASPHPTAGRTPQAAHDVFTLGIPYRPVPPKLFAPLLVCRRQGDLDPVEFVLFPFPLYSLLHTPPPHHTYSPFPPHDIAVSHCQLGRFVIAPKLPPNVLG